MRVLVIDPDAARAALVAQGLEGVQPLEVRHAAVQALGALRATGHAWALRACLADPEAFVRLAAAEAVRGGAAECSGHVLVYRFASLWICRAL